MTGKPCFALLLAAVLVEPVTSLHGAELPKSASGARYGSLRVMPAVAGPWPNAPAAPAGAAPPAPWRSTAASVAAVVLLSAAAAFWWLGGTGAAQGVGGPTTGAACRFAVPGRLWGALLALAAIVVDSPDAALLRGSQSTGAPSLIIVGWKFVVIGVMQVAFTCYERGLATAWATALEAWQWMIVSFVCGSLQILVTVAVLNTYAATAFAVDAMGPLWAAAAGAVLERENLRLRTPVAVLASLVGIAMVAVPVFAEPRGEQKDERESMTGIVVALASGFGFAGQIVCSGHAALRRPNAPLGLATGVGALALGAFALAMAAQQGDSLFGQSPRFFAFAIADGFSAGSFFLLFILAAAYLTTTELGLWGLAVVATEPLVAWAAYGEAPPMIVVTGCATLLCSVFAHEAFAFAEE